MMRTKVKLPGKPEKKLLKDYAKYSALAFQMIAIILLGLFGGIKLDEYLNLEFPAFTLTLTLLGLAFALYYLIKQVTK
ncbi:MAG: AtpZ/AtpI family protein [Bacteroidota bacterium]